MRGFLNKIRYNILYYYYQYTFPEKTLYNGSSPYSHIKVKQVGSKLQLIFFHPEFGTEFTESELDLLDPLNLSLEYTRLTFASLIFFPKLTEIKRILMIGLGGGVFCPMVRKYLPQAEMDIVEIDEEIIRLARRFFGFEESSQIKLYREDIRDYIKRSDRKYDLVLSDPCLLDNVPSSLRSLEYYRELKKIITVNGVFSGNTAYGDRYFDSEIKAVRKVFGNSCLFHGNTKNGIIIASDRSGKYSKDSLISRARELDRKYRFHFKMESLIGSLRENISNSDGIKPE